MSSNSVVEQVKTRFRKLRQSPSFKRFRRRKSEKDLGSGETTSSSGEREVFVGKRRASVSISRAFRTSSPTIMVRIAALVRPPPRPVKRTRYVATRTVPSIVLRLAAGRSACPSPSVRRRREVSEEEVRRPQHRIQRSRPHRSTRSKRLYIRTGSKRKSRSCFLSCRTKLSTTCPHQCRMKRLLAPALRRLMKRTKRASVPMRSCSRPTASLHPVQTSVMLIMTRYPATSGDLLRQSTRWTRALGPRCRQLHRNSPPSRSPARVVHHSPSPTPLILMSSALQPTLLPL